MWKRSGNQAGEAPFKRGEKSNDLSDLATSFKSQIFGSLARWDLEKILEGGEVKRMEQGHILFSEGSYGGTMFIVKSGAVELLRKDPETGLLKLVAYAKKGEPIGELAMFTNQRLMATARVPEHAVVVQITLTGLKRTLTQHPELALRICTAFAKALSAAREAMDDSANAGSSLGGSLASFDIGSVIMNLVEAGDRSGTLVVMDRRGQTVGEVAVRGHELLFARTKDNVAEDAVLELIVGGGKTGSFRFVPDQGAARNFPPFEGIESAPTSLILDGLRMRDELKRYENEIYANETQQLHAVSRHLRLPESGLYEAFLKLKPLIQANAKLSELTSFPHLTRLQMYEALDCLIESEQVAIQ